MSRHPNDLTVNRPSHMTTICPSCERPLVRGITVCPYCGEPISVGFFVRIPIWGTLLTLYILYLVAMYVQSAMNGECGILNCITAPFAFCFSRYADSLLPAVLIAVLLLAVCLPVVKKVPGMPVVITAKRIASEIIWRILFLADTTCGAFCLFSDGQDLIGYTIGVIMVVLPVLVCGNRLFFRK